MLLSLWRISCPFISKNSIVRHYIFTERPQQNRVSEKFFPQKQDFESSKVGKKLLVQRDIYTSYLINKCPYSTPYIMSPQIGIKWYFSSLF